MPLSSVAVGFVDFLITFGIYVVVTAFFRYPISWQIVFLPCFILLTFITSMGFGLFFAVLNVRFRDIGQLIPFLVQVGMYVCPVAYSSRQVEGMWYEKYYNLNPLVGIIDGFRWCLLGDKSYFNPQSLYSTVITSSLILIIALIYFRKKENTFVDHI
jgi:lipopolysaccharide transport system permease protein